MTPLELRAKWEQESIRFEHYDAQVDGARLCRDFLSDLAAVRDAGANEVLTLKEAAEHSGYSRAHLMRLVKQGRLSSLRATGRGRLTFLRADLPRKPGIDHNAGAGVHELASRLFGGKEGRHGQS